MCVCKERGEERERRRWLQGKIIEKTNSHTHNCRILYAYLYKHTCGQPCSFFYLATKTGIKTAESEKDKMEEINKSCLAYVE